MTSSLGALGAIGANYDSDEEEEDNKESIIIRDRDDPLSESGEEKDVGHDIQIVKEVEQNGQGSVLVHNPLSSSTSTAFKEFRNKESEVGDEGESSGSGTEDSEDDSSSASEDDEKDKANKKDKANRKKKIASDDDEDDDEFWDSSSTTKVTKRPTKAKGELGLEDLPPIQDLHISVPHERARPIGLIKSVVEPLVVVEAIAGTPALDIDSVLFLEQGDRALGRIFDVIGPVKQPWYCVRFNSLDHIKGRGVEVGMQVYCAPAAREHTSFVLVAQLEQMKGTDASWLDDMEVPPEAQDFSDDEQEIQHRKGRKKTNRGNKWKNNRNNPPNQSPGGGGYVPNPHYSGGPSAAPSPGYQYNHYQHHMYQYSWHNHPASRNPNPNTYQVHTPFPNPYVQQDVLPPPPPPPPRR